MSAYAAVERLTADLGLSDAHRADQSRRREPRPRRAIIAARDAVSGVNLDEEAANMLRYQQAYAAAAQIIAVRGQKCSTRSSTR